MRQYLDAKRQHRDAIVLFRMGDFYEMFFEDAITASRVLELTLTSRSKDTAGSAIPMCGMPYHAVDGYLSRLIRKGYRVAICEQVEDPKKAKGLVKREVTRVVSPGTFTDAGYLDAREPAFLAAVAQQGPDRVGRGVPRRLDGRVPRPPKCGRRCRAVVSRRTRRPARRNCLPPKAPISIDCCHRALTPPRVTSA